MKIYVASSWKNPFHNAMVEDLMFAGYEVYNYRNQPESFQWADISPRWQVWSNHDVRSVLEHNEKVELAFEKDKWMMDNADVCILLLPSGRSSHMEAGYMVGKGKNLIIAMFENERPDTLYKLAYRICVTKQEIFEALNVIR